jgi:DNA-binding transcriptional LysR family regulator
MAGPAAWSAGRSTRSRTIELVRRGDATFGIGYSRSDDPTLRSRVLFKEHLVVVAAADHPRAGKNVRSLRALRSERWFAFGDKWPRTETNARYVAGLLAVAEIPAQQIQLIDSLTAQKRLVEAGFGIALMPTSSVDDELGQAHWRRSPRGSPTTRVVLTTRAGAYLAHASRSLLDALVAIGGDPPVPASQRRKNRWRPLVVAGTSPVTARSPG